MLGKCCLFGVPDLFLTFPGAFFNFKKISTGSQIKNNFSDRRNNIITNTRNTSTNASSRVAGIVVVVAVALVVVLVVVVIVIVKIAIIRGKVDGWMDARQVLPFWYF